MRKVGQALGLARAGNLLVSWLGRLAAYSIITGYALLSSTLVAFSHPTSSARIKSRGSLETSLLEVVRVPRGVVRGLAGQPLWSRRNYEPIRDPALAFPRGQLGGVRFVFSERSWVGQSGIRVRRSRHSGSLREGTSGDHTSGVVTIKTEDFEGSWPNDWTVTGDPTWAPTTYRQHGGSKSGYCVAGGSQGVSAPGPYSNNCDGWMIYGPFDLSDAASASLEFYFWQKTQMSHDWLKYGASHDGTTFAMNGASGGAGQWRHCPTNIPAFNFSNYLGDDSVWLAFRFTSDSTTTDEGVYLDDIVLTKTVAPNLTPYQPAGWDDKIVVSNTTGTHTDDSPLYDDQTLYVDWAVINDGTQNIPTSTQFLTRLYVDGNLIGIWGRFGLDKDTYFTVADHAIGPLAAGTHTVKVITDVTDVVAEADETDNEYQRTFEVITNSPPSQPTVDVTPDNPKTSDDLTCSASGSTDPDGDPVTYQYQWYKDGVLQSGETSATLSHTKTQKGEVWKCVVTPTDGRDNGPSAEDQVTVENSAPVFEWLGVGGYTNDGYGPYKGQPNTTLFTFKAKLTDADGTAPQYARVTVQRSEDCRVWTEMTTLDLTPTSGTWGDGMVCEASATLPNGSYRYVFTASDDEGAAATGEPTRWHRGPKMEAPPQLWCTGLPGRETDFVHPDTGTTKTRFRFSVMYTDGQGDPPRVRRISIQRKRQDGSWGGFCSHVLRAWGGKIRRGKFFSYARYLPPGEYRYRFIFQDEDGPATGSDSQYADATQWQYGLTVAKASSADSATAASGMVTALSAVSTARGAQITFTLGGAASIQARLVNMAGRTVRTICRGRQGEAGLNTLVWDGRSDNGLPVPNGAYLVEVVATAPDGGRCRALATLQIYR